jgi:hypothetical protein
MASRNRIHKSSLQRHRGPTHTHDYPVKSRKRRDEEEGTVEPKYGTDRQLEWDEEGSALETDLEYGAGERLDDEDLTDPRPQRVRKRRGGESEEAIPEFDEGFQDDESARTNYDNADKIYPPSWH